MNFLLALGPIVIILILMVGLSWKASRAGAAGYLSALFLALAAFQTGRAPLAAAHAKGVFLILDVLYIIWTAYFLYRVVELAGGIEILSEMMPYLTADRGMQALLIGWAFASFLQGVGGFGVPVAVVAPMLVGLGFSPIQAVVIPSLGHSWAVTFGSLGSSFNAMLAATGLESNFLAPAAALFLGFAGILIGWIILIQVNGQKTLRRLWLPAGILGLGMASAQYFAATRGLWNIAGLTGGSMGLLIGIPLSKIYRGASASDELLDRKKLLTAVSGYLLLIGITLFVQLVPPVRDLLGGWSIGWTFPTVTTGLGYSTPGGPGRQLYLLRHAGTILLVTSLLSYHFFRRAGWIEKPALRSLTTETADRMLPSSVGITSIVLMAVVMQHAGMIDILAAGFSSAVQEAFPLLSPWLGALGAFMTGSNTNSNLVMSQLQLRTAELLGLPATIILAAQTTGGALGSVIAPTKIIVGASTAGLSGKEGQVLRALLPMIAGLLVVISILTAVVIGVI
jgi:lactate permease